MLLLLAALTVSLQTDGEDWLVRGKELFLQGSYPEAIEALRQANALLEEPADRLDAHLTLALIHEARAEDEQTLMALQWALVEKTDLVLDPDLYSPKTRAMLERARAGAFERLLSAKQDFTAGRLRLALEEFQLAAALLSGDPDSAQIDNVLDALLSAALIEQTFGDEGATRKSFRRALALRPELTLDADFYSPTTVALFGEVRDEAEDVLARARAAIREGKLEEARSVLERGEELLYAPRQALEARVLSAYTHFSAGERDRAGEGLTRVMSEQPSIRLDAEYYDARFLNLAESVRVVATRGLPRIAIIQSSASAVHQASRQGFEEVTLAEFDSYVLSEDDDARVTPSNVDLVYALGAEALDRASACCRGVPLIASNLPAGAAFASGGDGDTPRGGVLWNVTIASQIPVALRALPAAQRIGVVVGPDGGDVLAEELRKGLAPYGVELVTRDVRSEDEVADAVASMVSRIDLFWYLPDPVLASVSTFESVRTVCDRGRKPIFAFHESLVRAGAYVGVSADFTSLGRQAGRMAVAYLGSRTPSALSVVPADASRVVLNLAAAERLDIDPDPTLVSLAATVYR